MSEVLPFKKPEPKSKEKDDSEVSLEETVRKNKENAERLRIEREKANKGVIRSYRLKQ